MPNQPEPRNNLGLVFEAVGRMDDAVKAYDDALKLEPDGANYLGNAARARVRRGDKGPELRDLLSKLIERDRREEWVSWAKERLAMLPKTASN
jgi:cytochrome c-type biogenesis protein CcmH/NrfG